MKEIKFFEAMLAQRYDIEDDTPRRHYKDHEWYACNAYEFAKKVGAETPIFRDVCWDTYPEPLTALLLELGIEEFGFTCPSNNLLNRIYDFQNLGWNIAGVKMMPTCEPLPGTGRPVLEPGLILKFGEVEPRKWKYAAVTRTWGRSDANAKGDA